jgi:hypothetical protein
VTTWTQITIDEVNRVPFPSTLCAHIVQPTAVVGTLRLRISGYDQYGMPQVETTPSVALVAKTNNYVYLSKIFSYVERVEFQSTGIDIGDDTINLGTRYDWTRTIDAANEHLHGLNLGVALFRWTGQHQQGAANPARHKLENREPAGAIAGPYEVIGIQIMETAVVSVQEALPVIGQADGADWEASPDKWYIPATDITWTVAETAKVAVYHCSRATAFHR